MRMKMQLGHIGDGNRSAEEYRRLADEHAQTLKDFWKRFAVSGLFVLALVIILFASLAWFAANNRVNATSATISAKAARYSISGSSEDDAQIGSHDKDAAFDTNDSLNVSATYNLNNNSKGQLRPGSSGVLQVTVTPVAGDVRDITLTLERNIKLREGVAEDFDTDRLQNLFRGHILFFFSKSYDGYYSGPLLGDKITIKASQFCEDGLALTTKPVTFYLYWVWPSQFSNYVLTGSVNYNKNLFASTTSDGYDKLIDAINENNGWFFSSTDAIPPVSGSMSSAELQICTNAYNAGDELLGTNAEYLQIRFVGEEASQ